MKQKLLLIFLFSLALIILGAGNVLAISCDCGGDTENKGSISSIFQDPTTYCNNYNGRCSGSSCYYGCKIGDEEPPYSGTYPYCYCSANCSCPNPDTCTASGCQKQDCVCSDWKEKGCGKLGCQGNKMAMTRDCTDRPDGTPCDDEQKCVADPNCETDCQDSDGKDRSTAGECIDPRWPNSPFKDSCDSDTKVREFYCLGNQCVSDILSCAEQGCCKPACKSGACTSGEPDDNKCTSPDICRADCSCGSTPVCGNKNCEPGECKSGCKEDCSIGDCCGKEGCNAAIGETAANCDDCKDGNGGNGGNGVNGEAVIEPPMKHKTFEELIEAIINILFVIALIVAPLLMIIAGFLLLTAAGDVKKVDQAKKMIFYAAIGLAIVLMSYGIIAAIKSILGVKTGT